jgi:hypothetical protein
MITVSNMPMKTKSPRFLGVTEFGASRIIGTNGVRQNIKM